MDCGLLYDNWMKCPIIDGSFLFRENAPRGGASTALGLPPDLGSIHPSQPIHQSACRGRYRSLLKTGDSGADTCGLVEALRKDKTYRRYASGVERALSLFDSTLQEWADYISFLGRLLKVWRSSTAEERSQDSTPRLVVTSPSLQYQGGAV